MTGTEASEAVPKWPWTSLRPADDQDSFRWWDCECTAYDGEPTLDAALAAAEDHGRKCFKGSARWADANASRPTTASGEPAHRCGRLACDGCRACGGRTGCAACAHRRPSPSSDSSSAVKP